MCQFVKENKQILLAMAALCMVGMLVTSHILRQTSLHFIGTCTGTGSGRFLHFRRAMNDAGKAQGVFRAAT
ncbi:MAG TPA: hypothetical protein IAC21_07415 [Candidatus Enterenecus merdae]|nr:hypothetical protein [Candidatus Enterenecus merdae]